MDSRGENHEFLLKQMLQDVNKASKYIKKLKERVEKLNEEVSVLQSANHKTSLSSVKVETLEKGFRVKVFSDQNCPGLLVAVLEAFEELGLDILDATGSCAGSFSLQVISEREGQMDEDIDGQVVKQAVLQAIGNWNEKTKE